MALKPLCHLLFLRTTSVLTAAFFPSSLVLIIFSHEGHVVAFWSWINNGDDAPAFADCSSCNSFFNLLFSSVKLSQHFFKNSQSTSFCFNFVLQRKWILTVLIRITENEWRLHLKLMIFIITSLSCFETKLQLVLVPDSIARPTPASGTGFKLFNISQ